MTRRDREIYDLLCRIQEGYERTEEEQKELDARWWLDLSGTQVRDLSPLSSMTGLTSLFLGRTQVRDLSPLSGLTRLTVLDLRGTQVRDLSPLSNLTGLTSLNLFGTQVRDLSPLSNLTGLRGLNLSGTQVRDWSPLSSLTGLTSLALSRTQVRDLSPLKNLRNLTHIDLESMRLKELPRFLLDLKIPFRNKFSIEDGIYLSGTVIATQPVSLFFQPRKLIKAYYDEEKVPINESKVVFLGPGGSGKSHTIGKICKGAAFDSSTLKATPGIDFQNYEARRGDHTFQIQFWDFGGQEIMHAMHQCFLTERTSYVLVLSRRQDADLNAQARYWLRNIQTFAPTCRVLLALNKFDDVAGGGVDMNRLTEEFPNLISEPVYYSAVGDVQGLTDAIIDMAAHLDSSSMEFPRSWANIRNKLRDSAKVHHYITQEDYQQFCQEEGVAVGDIRTWLLDWFNDLGTCFSYHREAGQEGGQVLEEYKLLDPRWLTNAIYILINHGREIDENGNIIREEPDRNMSHKGILKSASVDALLAKYPEYGVLKNVTYEKEEQAYVLQIMRKFGLSFAVSDGEFIPALCDENTPANLHPTDYRRRCSYQMRYKFLPDSVAHRLMIGWYPYLNGEKLWRKGMLVEDRLNGLTAVVDMGGGDDILRIDVYATGEEEPWKLLQALRSDLMEINRKLGLKAEDYIVARDGDAELPVLVRALFDFKAKGQTLYPVFNAVRDEHIFCDINELLGMAIGEENVKYIERTAESQEKSPANVYHDCTFNIYNYGFADKLIGLLEQLIEENRSVSREFTDYLIEQLEASGDKTAKQAAEAVKQGEKEKKNPLQSIRDFIEGWGKTVGASKTILVDGPIVADKLKAILTALLMTAQVHGPDMRAPIEQIMNQIHL